MARDYVFNYLLRSVKKEYKIVGPILATKY